MPDGYRVIISMKSRLYQPIHEEICVNIAYY